MKKLNKKTKKKLLKIIKKKYFKDYKYHIDNNDIDYVQVKKNFNEIHTLSNEDLTFDQIHIIQIILELFDVNVSAYCKEIEKMSEIENFDPEQED